MRNDKEAAARYRLRAEELRTIADATLDRHAKTGLLQAADSYEQMAVMRERAERLPNQFADETA
jgi:hypothetical protein